MYGLGVSILVEAGYDEGELTLVVAIGKRTTKHS